MTLQDWLTGRTGVSIGMMLGQTLPVQISHRVTDLTAFLLARRQNALVRSVAINQQGIHQETLSPQRLRQAVEEVFRQAGRSFVDLYSSLKHPSRLQQKIVENRALDQLLAQNRDSRRGTFIVAPHMSSFDLMLLAAAARGFKAKVLTFGNPSGGYRMQNRVRATSGLDIIPVGPQSHREAIRTLREGGTIVTAIDRPIPGQDRFLNFFGRPSPLPDGHVRMALKADVPIMVAAVHRNQEDRYELSVSEPLELIPRAGQIDNVRQNAERILRRIEQLICRHPSQWQMYYPAWSDQYSSLTELTPDSEVPA